jgi:hypothetical protein
MKYDELIDRVLKDGSVNAVAKKLGIPQRTMDRYVKRISLPTCTAAIAMAREAGVSTEEAVEAIADEEMKTKPHKAHGHTDMVERRRIELPTFALRTRRSPS